MDPEDTPQFLNPWEEIERSRNKLPHWQQDGATYFLTFRLADAIPKAKCDQWLDERDQWLDRHPKPWTPEIETEYHNRFSSVIDRWLDAGHGSCVLREVEIRGMVESALRHFDQDRYSLHSWIIMPNHVHAPASLSRGWKLEQVLHSWKSYTAQRINQRLGKSGELWQEDSYNRLIRNAGHFANVVSYIKRNPEKARLGDNSWTLYLSEFASRYVEA
jgi:putative transposase